MNFSGKERRKSPRRSVLDSFSLFAAIASQGDHRYSIFDLSETGIGLDGPMELPHGKVLEIQFYFNQTLYVTVKGRIVRSQAADNSFKTGVEFIDSSELGFQAISSFLKTLDILIQAAANQK